MVDKIPICRVCGTPTLHSNQICVICSSSFSVNPRTDQPELDIA
jgi:hypothetical protein